MEENIFDNFNLAYDSLMNAATAQYPAIHKIRIKVSKENDSKKAYASFIQAMNEVVIPHLAKQIRQQHESLADAAERIKQLHIEYLNKRELPPIVGKKPIEGITSQVEFIRETLPEQGNNPAQSSCYKRNGEGLPGIRKHTFGKITYYHHASPVPYELSNYKQRIAITRRNFQQLKQIVKGQPVTEIRLLSPLAAPFRWFDFSQKQYDQTTETYLAMLLNNNGMRMFVYGTNRFRANYDELQTCINTRSFNDLFLAIIPKLGIKFPLHHAINIQRLKHARQKLAFKLIDADKKTALQLIMKHHALEREIFNMNIGLWYDNQKNIPEENIDARDFNQVLKLTDTDDWTKPEHNYQLQATLVRLESSLGQCVATGCNDCKDRDGRLAVTVEAHEIFYKQKKQHYPDTFKEADRKALQQIEAEVYQHSTPRLVAEAISIPGANQLEISAKDGNEHLPIEKYYLAHMFKDMHQLPLKVTIQDNLASTVKKEKAIRGNWLAATVAGIVFSVFTALFGVPEIATASTVPVVSSQMTVHSISDTTNRNTSDEMPGMRSGSYLKMGNGLKNPKGESNKKRDDALLIEEEEKKENDQSDDNSSPPKPTDTPPSHDPREPAVSLRSVLSL